MKSLVNSEHKKLLTQYLNRLRSIPHVPIILNIDDLQELSWEENITAIKDIKQWTYKVKVIKELIATIKQTKLIDFYKDYISDVLKSCSERLDTSRIAIPSVISVSVFYLQYMDYSNFQGLFDILKSLTEARLMETFLSEITQIFTEGFKNLENEMDIHKKLVLYVGILFAMKDTKLADIFSTQVNDWFSSLFQATKNTKLCLELAQAFRYSPQLVTAHIDEFLIPIKELPPLEKGLRSLQELLYIINPEQIPTDSPILKETIELIMIAMEQGAVKSFYLDELLFVLKRVSMVNVYSSRLKTLITCKLTNIEAGKRGYVNAPSSYSLMNGVNVRTLYHLMNGAKDTPLMDFFIPRFEELFLKMLEELEEMDTILLDQYFDNDFPNFFDVVKDTKLEKVLNRFCTKLDIKLEGILTGKEKLGNIYVELNGMKINGIYGVLDMSDRNIKDISEVNGLKSLKELQKLYLHNNDITEIKGLEFLTNLKQLTLSENQITEIKGLESLVNLESLILNKNQITEIKGLESLVNLESLILNKNQITEIKGLDSLVNLKALSLSGNQITEIKGLESLVNLESLSLNNNQITEIKGLDSLVNLQRLCIRDNNITEIKSLKFLVNLYSLDFWNLQISKDMIKELTDDEIMIFDSSSINLGELMRKLSSRKRRNGRGQKNRYFFY